MRHVVVIHNPAAGKKQLAEQREDITLLFEKHFANVRWLTTSQEGDAARFVRETAAETDLIVGAGGDGTINEIINALAALEHRPAFAIMPGGTCNDFSRTLGMSQNPLQAAEQIVKSQRVSVDVGTDGNQYFLNFWGIGLITSVSQNIEYGEKERFGRLSYYMSALREFRDVSGFQLKLEAAERQLEEEVVMVIVGNGPFTGGVRAFFPENSIRDGRFDVLVIKNLTLETALAMFQSKVTQSQPEHPDLYYFQTDRLRIETPTPQQIDCDGERRYHTPAELRILPGHLQMLTGDIDADTL